MFRVNIMNGCVYAVKISDPLTLSEIDKIKQFILSDSPIIICNNLEDCVDIINNSALLNISVDHINIEE